MVATRCKALSTKERAAPVPRRDRGYRCAQGNTYLPGFQGSQIGDFTVLAPTRGRYVSLIHELDKTPTSYAEDAAKSIGRIITDAMKAAKEWVLETWGTETLGDNLSTSASNESCIVQMADFDGRKVLLTADVGPIGLAEAADRAQTIGWLSTPKFIQVPHHGSRHNVPKQHSIGGSGCPSPTRPRSAALPSRL